MSSNAPVCAVIQTSHCFTFFALGIFCNRQGDVWPFVLNVLILLVYNSDESDRLDFTDICWILPIIFGMKCCHVRVRLCGGVSLVGIIMSWPFPPGLWCKILSTFDLEKVNMRKAWSFCPIIHLCVPLFGTIGSKSSPVKNLETFLGWYKQPEKVFKGWTWIAAIGL